ncbi:MAG: Peptidoglycan glycosyltransferase [Candidatus Falkowbacteria bacterium GW2011_GWC2_38_22]|uniref:Peptidoglycan glycosyltransferase n=1 Tax=Candidatus Falkowbacteria bacterium GW2011_GWE1_38_31 TaxID=1618638 RepID=A0A0G0JSJ8_9BACT|nr:MAG: Peptidoglycan glycosyltransferase [Candidatus Falkowbacteria bacterium GW2011_GWF2_38_1205]KKQ60544.1 MAG: Peptidoglycan glycosyltransferase [Candidatus Falkowbacteria bacterium GW2011_GWC2_38_22]KKQ62663.1 MAG: Peptidoglycan glycosyltransferase [Candidatus Falkowbacteria bacterium GW2011_GWF1_38_22]KKQ64723.1 MAG: Peptidoglycan glycosyltransferase [Candidatus Falkowbacteria bacterium GW2011_GWE2_38_254]KKQ69602.1 MAG: Peptidoglycan glycosyltransferase [Candidatus Falkowbacteria bacteri
MIRNKNKNSSKENSNRLNFILAVVFLLCILVVIRLFILQVSNHDLYIALASDQHQVYNKLEPKRGQIFFQDIDNTQGGYYPVATNKDFALVYAVPQKIEDPAAVAESLYKIFDEEKIIKEVEDLLASDEFFKQASTTDEINSEKSFADDKSEEFYKIKKEAEIELRKKMVIEGYIAKLSKKHDPYEPLKSKVDEDVLKRLMDLNIVGIDYILENFRFYPEKNIGSQILGFVSDNREDRHGQYGLEGFFDDELTGSFGSIKAERAAKGGLIIVKEREYNQPVSGSDLVLTINRSIQFTACGKLREAVLRHGADGGSVVIMDPKTGAIIAMCSYPDYDPNEYKSVDNIDVYNNPAIFYQWEPGSIFKAITMASSLDQGKISPETTYVDNGFVMIEGWPKPIRNSDFETKGGHGVVNMVTVLEESLNTGVIFAMQKIGAEKFAEYVKNFGFGEKTGIELETESGGRIGMLEAKNIRPIEAATATFGQGITVTPLQMINAFAAIANGGILMQPYLVKEIRKENGEKTVTQSREIRRVISARTAALVSGMLVKVVDKGHGKRAGVDGYYIAGKTGTAQVPKKGGGYEENAHIGSFAGFGPVDDPVFAMLVKIDNPRDVEWAESSAAPLFGEIADFILNYYQVPKER